MCGLCVSMCVGGWVCVEVEGECMLCCLAAADELYVC